MLGWDRWFQLELLGLAHGGRGQKDPASCTPTTGGGSESDGTKAPENRALLSRGFLLSLEEIYI